MIEQLPIIDPLINVGEKAIDTALVTSPATGNGYGLALATPYIFLFALIIALVVLGRIYIKRQDRIAKEEQERKDKQRNEELNEKRAFGQELKQEIIGMRRDNAEGLKAIREELKAEGKEWRAVVNDLDKRLFRVETRLDRDNSKT